MYKYKTYNFFIERAKKFKTRNEWRTKESGTYQYVYKKRPQIKYKCTEHMISYGNPLKGYQVYAYLFEDNTAYIGITCTPAKRHANHKHSGPVSKKLKDGIPHQFLELRPDIPLDKAERTENASLRLFSQKGYGILNTKEGGSKGAVRWKHTYERTLGIARQVGSKKKFHNQHPSDFQAANKYGWLRQLEKDLGWPRNANQKWTFDKCLKSAEGHDRIMDWHKTDRRAYDAAHSNGWLPQIKQEVFA